MHCPERNLRSFISTGLSRISFPDATEIALTDPVFFVERACGIRPAQVEVSHLRPIAGQVNFTQSDRETPLHTDSHPFQGHCAEEEAFPFPAHVQFLICLRPARRGGDSEYLDSWSLAAKIAKVDAALHSALFNEVRTLHFATGPQEAYTFSLRRDNLVFIHPPFPHREDRVGIAFQSWVDREPRSRLRLETGEALMASNHRLLHARSSFRDRARHLLRILAWFERPIETPPAELRERARLFERPLSPDRPRPQPIGNFLIPAAGERFTGAGDRSGTRSREACGRRPR